METIGQRFKKIRTESGLSQIDFGSKIGLSKSAVSAVENDKSFVSPAVMRTIFMEFNINLNWLICGAGGMHNIPCSNDIKAEIFAQVSKMLEEKGLN